MTSIETLREQAKNVDRGAMIIAQADSFFEKTLKLPRSMVVMVVALT